MHRGGVDACARGSMRGIYRLLLLPRFDMTQLDGVAIATLIRLILVDAPVRFVFLVVIFEIKFTRTASTLFL